MIINIISREELISQNFTTPRWKRDKLKTQKTNCKLLNLAVFHKVC
jgi:hypothetical protein